MVNRDLIVILEDNFDRRRVMLDCLRTRHPQFDVRFLQTAAETIANLRE